MGERRELNPRMVDPQSTALIHLATSAFFRTCLFVKKNNDLKTNSSKVIVFQVVILF